MNVIKTFTKIAASLAIVSGLVLGSGVPASAGSIQAPTAIGVQVSAGKTHKAATVSRYFSSKSACYTWIQKEANMIDKWSGYSVYYLNCRQISGKWKGYVQYRYWA